MLAVMASLNLALGDFAPEYARAPNKAMLRIYRDVTDLVVERFRAFQPVVDFLNLHLAATTPFAQEAATGRRRSA